MSAHIISTAFSPALHFLNTHSWCLQPEDSLTSYVRPWWRLFRRTVEITSGQPHGRRAGPASTWAFRRGSGVVQHWPAEANQPRRENCRSRRLTPFRQHPRIRYSVSWRTAHLSRMGFHYSIKDAIEGPQVDSVRSGQHQHCSAVPDCQWVKISGSISHRVPCFRPYIHGDLRAAESGLVRGLAIAPSLPICGFTLIPDLSCLLLDHPLIPGHASHMHMNSDVHRRCMGSYLERCNMCTRCESTTCCIAYHSSPSSSVRSCRPSLTVLATSHTDVNRILGDARDYELSDYEDAYYMIPLGEDGDMEPDHKHILNQDDRFCYTPTARTNQNIYYMYYTCVHTNSMTLWDIFTLLLLSLAMLEKLAQAHEELAIQVLYASHWPNIKSCTFVVTHRYTTLHSFW